MAEPIIAPGIDQDRWQPITLVTIYPMNKGLSSGIESAYVPPEFVYDMNNMFITRFGTRKTRPGLEFYGDIQNPKSIQFLMDLWRYSLSSGKKEQSVIALGGNAVYADTGNASFEYKSAVDIDNKLITGDVLVGLAMIGIEGVGLHTYNQTTWDNITISASAPNAWIVRKHRGSFWVAGIDGFPELLKKSDTESTDFSGGTSFNLNLDLGAVDRTGITSLFPEFYGKLYISKSSSLFELDTSVAAYPLRPVSDTIGSLSHNATVSVNKIDPEGNTSYNTILLPSYRGIEEMKAVNAYGDIAIVPVSQLINDLWFDDVDFTQAQRMSAMFVPEYASYMLLYPRRSGGYSLLGYQVNTGDWYHWENYPATFISRHICPITNCYKMLIGDSQGRIARGRSVEDTTYLDIDTAYSSSFTTPPIFPEGKPIADYKFMTATIYFKPRAGDIDISYTIDNGTTRTDTITQSGYVANGPVAYKTINLNGYGSSITFTFNSTSTYSSEEVAQEVLGIIIECLPYKKNRIGGQYTV